MGGLFTVEQHTLHFVISTWIGEVIVFLDFIDGVNKCTSKVNVLKFCTPVFLTKSHLEIVQTQVLSESTHFAIPLSVLRNNCI